MPEREPASARDESPEVDWSSAVVSADGRLEVGLTGKPDKRWRESFQAIGHRLAREGRNQPWANLTIRSKGRATRVVIEGLEIEEGAFVEHVQQHLGAVIAQANAATAPDRAPAGEDRTGEREADPRQRAAQAATEAFRRLAKE